MTEKEREINKDRETERERKSEIEIQRERKRESSFSHDDKVNYLPFPVTPKIGAV